MTLWDLAPGLAERLGLHPSAARIMEWIDSEGPPPMLARVSAHLARCRRCAARAAEMERALASIALPAAFDPPPRWLSEGEEELRRSMAGADRSAAQLPDDLLEALLGRYWRRQTAAAAREIVERLLGSRALARAASSSGPGEVSA